MQYGNYVAADRNGIQAAKDELLEGLIDTIRELAKQDDFWIVRRCDPADPLDEILMAGGKDCTVGWKIDIPQMGYPTPAVVDCSGKIIGTLGSK